jgi:hypothetical protein
MFKNLFPKSETGNILILFLIGAALLHFVDENKGRAEAAYLSEKD